MVKFDTLDYLGVGVGKIINTEVSRLSSLMRVRFLVHLIFGAIWREELKRWMPAEIWLPVCIVL